MTASGNGVRTIAAWLAAGAVAGGCLASTVEGPHPLLPYNEGAATFVALPDTQIYAQDFPQTFISQTQWIVDNSEERNIAAVFHLGDITNRNTPVQWQNAYNAMNRLRGVVPCVFAQGNHDIGDNGSANHRGSLMSSYFRYDLMSREPSFGGVMDPPRVENSYHFFEAGGRKWIGIALEWGPRDVAIAWANQILAQHADRLAIITTHAYMARNNLRLDHLVDDYGGSPYNYGTANLPGGTSDGGDMWRDLVSQHPNVMFVLSGHISGESRLATPTPYGNMVHQHLADYQTWEGGGLGYLRLLEIQPDGTTVYIKTYSTLLDRYLTYRDSQFIVQLQTAPGNEGWWCPTDLYPIGDPDGEQDLFDVLAFFQLFALGEPEADIDRTGTFDVLDIIEFFARYGQPCGR